MDGRESSTVVEMREMVQPNDLESQMDYEGPVGADAVSVSPRVSASAPSVDEAAEHKGEDDEDRSHLERAVTDEKPASVDAGSPSPRILVSTPSAEEDAKHKREDYENCSDLESKKGYENPAASALPVYDETAEHGSDLERGSTNLNPFVAHIEENINAAETNAPLAKHIENLIPFPDHLPGCILALNLFLNAEQETKFEEKNSMDLLQRDRNILCCLRAIFYFRLIGLFFVCVGIQLTQFWFTTFLMDDATKVSSSQMAKWIDDRTFVWLNATNESFLFSGAEFHKHMKTTKQYEFDMTDAPFIARTPCSVPQHLIALLFGVIIVVATSFKDMYDIFYVYEYHFARAIKHHIKCCGECRFGPFLRLCFGLYLLIVQIFLNFYVPYVCALQITAISAEIPLVILAAVEAHFVLELDDLLVPILNTSCCLRGRTFRDVDEDVDKGIERSLGYDNCWKKEKSCRKALCPCCANSTERSNNARLNRYLEPQIKRSESNFVKISKKYFFAFMAAWQWWIYKFSFLAFCLAETIIILQSSYARFNSVQYVDSNIIVQNISQSNLSPAQYLNWNSYESFDVMKNGPLAETLHWSISQSGDPLLLRDAIHVTMEVLRQIYNGDFGEIDLRASSQVTHGCAEVWRKFP